MSLILRLVLPLAAALAAIFVAPGADNFPVVQGMMALVVVALAVLALALWRGR